MPEQNQPITLADVARQHLNLLSGSNMFLYVVGACLTTGAFRWLMVAMAVSVAIAGVAGALGRRNRLTEAAPSTLGFTVATSVMWGWLSPGLPFLATAFVGVSVVYAAWMLPRLVAWIAIVLVPGAFLVAQSASGVAGGVALQTLAMVVTEMAFGVLLVGIRTVTERRFGEHTRALAEVNTRLEALNGTDALTGLPNRRRLDETLDRAWAGARAAGQPLSLLMVDIDHFKQYNDHYGHLGGDACLAKVAAALAGGIRDADVVARFGGEEFSVIVPDADAGLAAEIAERVRGGVARLRVAAPDGHVTVSVGVASIVPAGDDTPRDLIRLADQALYEAKRNGRNRVEVAAEQRRERV